MNKQLATARLLVVSVTAVLTCSTAFAAEIKVAMRPVTSFGYLDSDKDQRLTPEEASADYAVAQGFQQADANRDGVLDKDEFASLSKG